MPKETETTVSGANSLIQVSGTLPTQDASYLVSPETQSSSKRFIEDNVLPRWMKLEQGRVVQIKVFHDTTAATTGDGKFIFFIPPSYNGLSLTDGDIYVTGVSSSGTITVQIRNITQSLDMFTTAMTIDEGEFSSLTAATASKINNANNMVKEGYRIAIDVDGAGTSAEGLGVVLVFS